MSKILFFSDIHFHHTHRFSIITDSGYTIREKEHLSCATDIIKIAEEENADKIVFGGDLYGPVGDNLSTQTQCVVLEFVNIISKWCKSKGIVFEMLVGNHDLSKNSIDFEIHKLTPFKYFDNVKVYDKPEIIDNYVYMPYCTDDTRAITFLENIEDKQNKIIFSHLDLAEIDLGNGIFTKKGVPLSLLHQFKKVLEGHYHSGGKYGNIIVSGSTQRLSFKDKGISRRNILIYDTDSDKIIRKSFNCPDWLVFTDDNIDEVLNISSNNYVRIELTTDMFLTDEIKAKLDTMLGKDIHIDISRISVNKQVTEELTTGNEQDILTTFVNKSENSAEQKEALIKEGIRLLEAVK